MIARALAPLAQAFPLSKVVLFCLLAQKVAYNCIQSRIGGLLAENLLAEGGVEIGGSSHRNDNSFLA